MYGKRRAVVRPWELYIIHDEEQVNSSDCMNMEWPNPLVLEYLEYYENEPAIWNTSHPCHKNRNEVYEAWKRIADKMGNTFSVNDLKKKKDSLMASYRACLKKVKDSNKSDVEACLDVYKPNWFAFEVMDRFLKDKHQPRETFTPEATSPDNKDQAEDLNDLDLMENLLQGDDDLQQVNEAISLPTCATFKPLPRKRFKAANDIEVKKRIYGTYTTLLPKLKPQPERTICDIYGELVAAKLKAMDEHSRDICMHRMDNILFEIKVSNRPAHPDNFF